MAVWAEGRVWEGDTWWLFLNGETPREPTKEIGGNQEIESEIKESEVKRATKDTRKSKATATDDIPIEM